MYLTSLRNYFFCLFVCLYVFVKGSVFLFLNYLGNCRFSRLPLGLHFPAFQSHLVRSCNPGRMTLEKNSNNMN